MTVTNSVERAKKRDTRNGVLSRLIRQPSGLFGLSLVLILILVAAFAPLIAPFDPNEQIRSLFLVAPGVDGHLLGTDELSRDILSRLIYGARVSILVGFFSVTIGGIIGVLLGMAAAMFGGVVETLIMRTADMLLAMPGILLGVVVVTALGPGLLQVCIAVALINVPVFARLMRSSVLREKELDYVRASMVLGAGNGLILFKHIGPNSIGVVVAQISAAAGAAVLIEAALSFIGLGVAAPTASWGAMLAKSRDYLAVSPLYALAPGFLVFVLVLGLNLFTDALQRVLNPSSLER